MENKKNEYTFEQNAYEDCLHSSTYIDNDRGDEICYHCSIVLSVSNPILYDVNDYNITRNLRGHYKRKLYINEIFAQFTCNDPYPEDNLILLFRKFQIFTKRKCYSKNDFRRLCRIIFKKTKLFKIKKQAEKWRRYLFILNDIKPNYLRHFVNNSFYLEDLKYMVYCDVLKFENMKFTKKNFNYKKSIANAMRTLMFSRKYSKYSMRILCHLQDFK